VRELVGPLLIVGCTLAVLVGIVSCEVSLWRECRADHSWFYCARVLNK
jgi:hypothetical protein